MTPLAQLLIEIMDIESVSGNEKELADWVEQRLSAFSHLTLHRDGDAIVAIGAQVDLEMPNARSDRGEEGVGDRPVPEQPGT